MLDVPIFLNAGVSLFVGISAVVLTQRLTREREDRARALVDRRSTVAGALTALRDFRVAELDQREAKLQSKALAESSAKKTEAFIDAMNNLADQAVKGAIPEVVDALKRKAESYKSVHEDQLSRFYRAGDLFSARESELRRAEHHLEYWQTMIELSCSHGLSQAFNELRSTKDEAFDRARTRFIELAQADLAGAEVASLFGSSPR